LVDETGARILDVEEKPELKLEIVAGIYCLTPDVFQYIPEDQYFGMDSLIKTLIRVKQPIARFLIEDYWLDIGQVEDYSKARAEVQQTFATESEPAGDGGGRDA
jgi:NDP-sugar pyrophosphorylase family protein